MNFDIQYIIITFVSTELGSKKPQFYGKARKLYLKQKPLPNTTLFLIGTRLFLNTSLAGILICLSGDVESNPGPINFEIKQCCKRRLKVCHLNIRSLLPKIDSLRLFINKNPFDVIAVTETWLKPAITDAELRIPNYTITRHDRTAKSGGGTALYIRDGLPYRTRADLQNDIETCWIEIIRPNTKSLFICSVYKPPNFNIENFIEKLENDISKIQEKAEVMLLGDLNVDYNQRSTAKSRLQTFVRTFSFEQLITSATRITQSSQSIIDLIFVNNVHRVVESGVFPLDISDHSLIFCVIKAGVAKSGGNYRDISYRCYKNYNSANFNRDLESVDWSFLDSISDISDTVNTWCQTFSETADKHAPIKTRRVKCTSKSPWITQELTQLMRERDYHQKQAHKTNSDYHWQKFRELRNYINNQIKLAKTKYYQDTVKANKDNPSDLWKTLNELTSRNKSGTNLTCVISEEKPITDQKAIATILNDYFTDIGRTLADKIRSAFKPRLPQPPTDLPYSFEFKEVDESFVSQELRTLNTNKATGLDQISAKLLKDSAFTITVGLTQIFNYSLLSQTFPDIWKKGKIVPIFKSNDPTSPNNYRPITILPILSKIMERIVHLQTYEYLKEHNLITSEQFGFRPNLSTSIALTRLTEEILLNLDNNLTTGAVFIDLRKAFDTVDHTLLIMKLRNLGFSTSVLNWFTSYLSSRTAVTSINNSTSTPKPVTVGVPQGSILGPLLFLIYINDLPDCLNNCKSILYADDTLLYYSAKSVKDLQAIINDDLQSLSHWLNDSLLTLNYDKTKFMIFTNRQRSTPSDINITINNKTVLQATSFKYLGLTLTPDLSWQEHIDNMITKISQRLGVLRRIKQFLDLDTRCTLYTSLILPLFDYADTIWGDKNNVVLMNSLQTLENKAAKIILDELPWYSATEALRRLNWTKLQTRRHNHRCTFIYKCMNGFIDFNFDLVKNENIHDHDTRRRSNLHLPKARTNKGKHRPAYQASLDFNNLETELKNAESLPKFKTLLKRRCIQQV